MGGKLNFLERMTREIERARPHYPEALFIGVAHGASDNWLFLNAHTSIQVTDFWHATEYLAQAAGALFPHPRNGTQKMQWLEDKCHKLEHNPRRTRADYQGTEGTSHQRPI
ncbi:MAG: hypothetical protein KDH88_01590 [Chromatiales bacterium]|nr:hypothetical protein [Chromatiales bacterium]